MRKPVLDLQPRDYIQIGSTLGGFLVAGTLFVAKVDRLESGQNDTRAELRAGLHAVNSRLDRWEDRLWNTRPTVGGLPALLSEPVPCPADATRVRLPQLVLDP